MSDAAMTERRREPRRRVLKAAKMMIDQKSIITCTARNLSDHGSRLSVDSVVGVPDEFVLEIAGEGRRQAQVVWKTFTEIGVALR